MMILMKLVFKIAVYTNPFSYDEMLNPYDSNHRLSIVTESIFETQYYQQTAATLSELVISMFIIILSKWTSRRQFSFVLALYLSSVYIVLFLIMTSSDCNGYLEPNETA
jgi:hypothetical protein